MKRRESEGRHRLPGRTSYTVLVYCGGLRTEPAYLDGLKRHLRNKTTTVFVRADGISPKQLVSIAAADRDRRPGVYDEVWCVVDVDEFDIAAAAAQARRQRIHLAVSNPCFELWLLLHHAACRSHCSDCGDVVSRLRRQLPAYDKTRLNFADYAAGIDDAVKRAKELDSTGENHQRNPSTGVWRLIETIMERR